MKNKKTVLITLMVSLVSSLALPAVAFSSAFLLPSQFDETYLSELPYKIDRLKENKDEKKIVLIGGSSVPFALKSKLAEKELADYRVIDFGLYAALGSKVMLDLALPYISKDDIVVFSPELHSQMFSLSFSPKLLWQAFDGQYSRVSLLGWDDVSEMISSIPEFSKSKFSYLRSGKKPGTDDIYMRSSFDEFGDISSPLNYANSMYNLFDSTMPISFSDSLLDEEFLSYVNDFYRKVTSKGAKMYYRFAPMNARAIVDLRDLDGFYQKLNGKLECPLMGNPHDQVMDPLYFFDTNYHLNSSGSIVFTRRLVMDLKLELGDDSVTSIQVPAKPLPMEKEFVAQNDEDMECFEYEENDKIARIVSLKPEFRNRESLIIPSMYHSKPVISFASLLFEGSQVRRVTVQDNIRELFDGCLKGVKEVILTNDRPSSIKVAQDLFLKEEGKIYVPDDVLYRYKVDYSWSRYSDVIYPYSEIGLK